MSLSSLSGAPPPGFRRSTQDAGGGSAPLSSLSGAPNLSGNKPKPLSGDDDAGFPGSGPPTFSKPSKASSSESKSAVRKSTPNPQTYRFGDDDEDFPKANYKKTVSFADKKGSTSSKKSPFNDDDDDFPRASKSSTSKNPFGDDDKPSTSRASGAGSSGVKPSATNPAFKWDDDSPPRSTTSAGRSGAGKGLFEDDDFLSSVNPDSIFSGKKPDDSINRSASAMRASGPSRPTGPKADDIFGMMKEEPPPITPDLGLDLFGATASKPAAGPRAGRRAAVQQSTEFSPEQSRDPTPEASRPMMSPEPSTSPLRTAPEGSMDRSASAPRGSYHAEEDFSEPPLRSAASTIGPGRGRGGETGPSVTSLVGQEGSNMSPPSRARPSGGGMELDGDDLPGLGSPGLLSKNTSSISVAAAAGPVSGAAGAAGRRGAPAAAAKARKGDDSWELDDSILPDDSGTPASVLPPKSPPLASGGSATSPSPTSGYVPSAETHAKSRLQHATFGGQKKDEEPRDDEPSMGGYMPSFGGPRRPSASSGAYGSGLGGTGVSTEYGAGALSGTALTPGGPGAPRPRRQLGASTDTSPLGGALSPAGGMGAAKPGAPPAKKSKEEEERERVAAAMAAAQARRQALLSGAPIRFPGQASAAPVPAAGSALPGMEAGVVTTPASPSPLRATGRPGAISGGFGKKAGLGLSSDSSDDDLPLPDKAISPPLPQARKAAAGAASHQPQRATSNTPLGRETTFDSRVASSVPEMGGVAAAAGLGAIPGPGHGSIVQSSAPAPPLHPEASYPHMSQPSVPGAGAATMPPAAPGGERSGTSLTSQPSVMAAAAQPGQQPSSPGAVTPQASFPAGVTSPTAQSSFPTAAATSGFAQQPSSPGAVTPQASFPPGVTSPTAQSSFPPGIAPSAQHSSSPSGGSIAPQSSSPMGVAAVAAPQQQQQQGPPPGVMPLVQLSSLPPGVVALQQQQQGLPPGVTALAPQQSVTATAAAPPAQQVAQQQGLPPGVTVLGLQQQQGLPPGVTVMAPQQQQQPFQGSPPGITAMGSQQQQGLPPGVTPMSSQMLQQHQSLPPGVTAMAPPPQTTLPPGVTAMGPQQQGPPPGVGAMEFQQRGLPPGVTPWGLQQQQQQHGSPHGSSPGYVAPPGLSRTPSVNAQRLSPEASSVAMSHSPDPRQAYLQHQPPPAQRPSTAFAVPPDSHTAVAVSRALPPQMQQSQQQQHSLHHSPSSLVLPGSMSPHSPGEITLASRVPIEALKESLVKSLQEELEKMSRQVMEVKTAYDKQLADVRADHERQVQDMRLQHEKQLAESRAVSERVLEEARTHHRKQLEDVHNGHERQLEDVRRRWERHAEETRVVQEKQLMESRAAQEKQLADARVQRERLVEDARAAQLKAVEDARAQHMRAHEDARAVQEKVLADTQAVHVKQVLELKTLYEAELRRAAVDVGRAVDDTRRMTEEARRQEAEARRNKEESMSLRDRNAGLEAEVRARDAALRESETRLVQLDTRSKTELAETQANAIKEAALMKLEMEDAKAALGRVRQQYEETTMTHAQELARYRAELDAQRVMAAEELQRARLAAAEQIAAAEARGRRAGMLDKEIAEATIRQQMAAIAEEKEVVSRHRLSAELLAQLTEKVRAVAVSSIEREERALSALERDVADREGRLAAREKLLGEREGRVAAREKEVDALRADLQNLMVTLETSAVHDREDLKREQLRLTREAARVEAAASSLQAEREDLRMQIALEKRLLEEAREARRKEREDLLTEVTGERRRLATEYADTQRQLDAARNELLAVRSRLVDLESRCNGTVTQAAEEEKKLEALRLEATQTRAALEAETVRTRKALEAETAQTRRGLEAEVGQTRSALQAEVAQTRESLRAELAHTRESLYAEVSATRESLSAEVAAAREALHVETSETREALRETKESFMMQKAHADIEARELVEYAAKLQDQSAELATQAADAEARHRELTAGLEMLKASQVELAAAQQQVEEQKNTLEGIKKNLDRERMALAEDRRALSEERLAASRAADEARSEQLKLTDAIRSYVQQGIPIPFVVDGATSRLMPMPPPMPLPSAAPNKHPGAKRRSSRPTARSRNALKHMLDRLGVDAAVATLTSPNLATLTSPNLAPVTSPGQGVGGVSGSSYVRAQQEFLEKMRLGLSAPAGGGVAGLSPSTLPKRGHVPPERAVTSPVPPGLNPALLPPSLAAAHARSAAVTPVKHATSTLPVAGRAELESERPSPAAFTTGMLLHNAATGTVGADGSTLLYGGGGGGDTTRTFGDGGYEQQGTSFAALGSAGGGGGDGAFGSTGGGTAVIQQLLDTIQLALKKSSRVTPSHGSEISSLEAIGRPPRQHRPANRPPRGRGLQGEDAGPGGRARGSSGGGGGGDGERDDGPRLNFRSLLSAVPEGEGVEARDGSSRAEKGHTGQAGGRHMSSEIASLMPLSSSSASLDLMDAPPAESPDLGDLGPHLDALAEELSASTTGGAFGPTPANTIGSRFPFGASLGSEDTFGTGGLFPSGGGGAAAARQRQLGELAAMSEVLAARLEALGLGEGTPSGEGTGAAGAGAVLGREASSVQGGGGGGAAAAGPSGGLQPDTSAGGGGSGSHRSSVAFSPHVGGSGSGMEAAGGGLARTPSGTGGRGVGSGTMSRQQSLQMPLSPSAVTAPSARTLLWGGVGSFSRGLVTAGSGAVGDSFTGGVQSRSAADTPLLGSANAEALQGMTLLQQAPEVEAGVEYFSEEELEEEDRGRGVNVRSSRVLSELDREPLSPIASVNSISDDNDAEGDDLVGGLDDDDDAAGLLP